jgi:hypothetical protein
MLKYSKGNKISLNLTLVNNDGSPESNAIVSYILFDDENNEILSNNSLVFNEQLGSYIDIINPEIDWVNQVEGIYFINWNISNTTEDYPNEIVEELYIELYDEKLDISNEKLDIIRNNISDDFNITDEKLDKILGLVHSNVYIDEPDYDKYGNLVSARLRTYTKSTSVGSDEDVLASYRIYSDTSSRGKFVSWQQIEID